MSELEGQSRHTDEAMSEPCCKCASTRTGPDYSTPYGICAECACLNCRGFHHFDDRGFLCMGQTFLTSTPCIVCGGEGLRPKEGCEMREKT